MKTRTPSYSRFLSGTSLLLAAFLLTGGILGYVASRSEQFHHQARVTLESSTPVETQFFYDTGRGFNENESLRQTVYRANAPATLNFEFDGKKIAGLRFDPAGSPARLRVHGIVVTYHREKPFAVPLDTLSAARDIQSLHYDGQTLNVETTGTAQDPILHLSRIGPAPRPSIIKIFFHIAAGAAIALGLAFFILWVYRNSLDPKEFDT